jgi:hypothetical protein
MKTSPIVSAFWLLSLPALAALPPHYQRQDELGAIMAHVVDEFGIGRPIESIIMLGTDFYAVTSGPCRMEVMIVDLAPEPGAEQMAGPRRFAVESGPLVCDD